MQFCNLDMITNRFLLERRLTKHYYAEALFHAATCLRELSLGVLKVINTRYLPIDENGDADLPPDFQDDISVAIPSGQRFVKLPVQNNFNTLTTINSQGESIPNSSNNGLLSVFSAGWGFYWNTNDYGEATGRAFGAGGGTNAGYSINKQRRKLTMNEGFAGTGVYLIYMSTGQSVDNASQIDWYAFSTIQTYIDWQTSPYAMDKDSAPARRYYNELSGLGFALWGMSAETIKNIIRQSYGFIKN